MSKDLRAATISLPCVRSARLGRCLVVLAALACGGGGGSSGPATLESLAVMPASPSLAKGLTQAFTATGTYSDRSTRDLTAGATWTSSDEAVATISNAAGSAGVATARGEGPATLTAAVGSVSGTANLTVTPAKLVSLAIGPSDVGVGVGATRQLSVQGTYTDGGVQDATVLAHWASSDEAVATLSNAAGSVGRATGVGHGLAQVTATVGSLSSTGRLVVGIVVDSEADTTASDGHCTLREAIANANGSDQSGSSDCAAGAASSHIAFALTSPATITLEGTLPAVTGVITFHGPEAGQLTVNGGGAYRILTVESGATLGVQGFALVGGSASDFGGALRNLGGTVNAENMTFSGNSANTSGGAISNEGGTLAVTSCVFSGNSSRATGGAIGNSSAGTVSIARVSFISNAATLEGGAVTNGGGTLTISSCLFSGNTAGGAGGALANRGATMVKNSTFTGNAAAPPGQGGAIANGTATGMLTIDACTLAANTGWESGAVFNGSSGTLMLRNSVLSDNVAGGGATNCRNQAVGPLIDGGDNLEDADTCGFGSGSFRNTDPLLLPLADNGGETQTMALDTGSPALDRIPVGTNGCGGTLDVDQRGVSRPQGSACDIGAFE